MALGKPQVSPTGLTLWPLSDFNSIVWPGPGSRLYLGFDATKVGGTLVVIEHPAADGSYDTRKEAAAAAAAFVKATEE